LIEEILRRFVKAVRGRPDQLATIFSAGVRTVVADGVRNSDRHEGVVGIETVRIESMQNHGRLHGPCSWRAPGSDP